MRQLKITKQITNRESKSLDKYLNEISTIEMINEQDEVILAQKIRQGDTEALAKMVKANLRFVVSVAKQYQNQGLTLNDLINEGNMGLIKAAKRFDETRGFKFISYAVWWIRQSILQALAEHARIIRLPLNRIGTLNQINRQTAEFIQKNERVPEQEELAEALSLPVEIIGTTRPFSTRHVSIDAPLNVDEEQNLLGTLENTDEPSPDGTLLHDSLRTELLSYLSILNKKEKTIVMHYFGIANGREKTLDEIALEIGLSRERVRQIKEKAIRKLRSNDKVKRLRLFL